MSAAFSPIMMVGALVLPPISVGMIEASTTRKPSQPCTFSSGSTTESGSVPISQDVADVVVGAHVGGEHVLLLQRAQCGCLHQAPRGLEARDHRLEVFLL